MAEKFKWKMDLPKIPLFDTAKADKVMLSEINTTMERSLAKTQSEIREKAPHGATGNLKASIKTKITKGGLHGEVGSELIYAEVQEFGGKRWTAKGPPADALVDWIRLSSAGQRFFAWFKKGRKRAKPIQAAIFLSMLIKKRGLRAKKYFKEGVDISWPYIVSSIRMLHGKLAKVLMK